MQDKTEDKPGASPKDPDPCACPVCELGRLREGAKVEIARELELASGSERLSKITGLHPDRSLADHLDALATRPGHEEVRRERAELRATLVEALGPLPTDHPHMLGQLRVKLAKALSYRDRCHAAAECTVGVRRRSAKCKAMAVEASVEGRELDYTRLAAKAFAYLHAADLAEMAAQEAP